MRKGITCVLLGLASVTAAASQSSLPAGGTADGIVRELVKPSAANPAIQQFDDNNVVLLPKGGGADVPLVVFLPGQEASRRMRGCCWKPWRSRAIE